LALNFFTLGRMKKPWRKPSPDQQALLSQLRVRLLRPAQLQRFNQLLDAHHDLGAPQPVGEHLRYVATDARGRWLALLLFAAPAKHLRQRDAWIGWSEEQRRRRLAFLANNTRLLPLPGLDCPNLPSRTLRLCLDRLSTDWQEHYGHPILLVETFVDPQRFTGATYRANGWTELGLTQGCGRCARDYYVAHGQPKMLFARELKRNTRRTLQAEHLPPALASVEAKVPPRCAAPPKALRSLCEHFDAVEDFRTRIGGYHLSGLLAMIACAHFCGAPRGPRDLAAFARNFTQHQRRALRVRLDPHGSYPSPSHTTFGRVLYRVPEPQLEAAVQAWQHQLRGPPPPDEPVVLDGKELRHSHGAQIVTAVTVPSQHYLGSALVEAKTNEIPAARQLHDQLDLQGRLVALDALHTNAQTARQLVQDCGADYLLVVKGNQATLRATLEQLVPASTLAAFPPSA
jgi:hypothetical protein